MEATTTKVRATTIKTKAMTTSQATRATTSNKAAVAEEVEVEASCKAWSRTRKMHTSTMVTFAQRRRGVLMLKLPAEANSFLTKEGLPSGMDGAVDGAIDTEVNKYQKDL
jgi:uncharacterized membrane protein YdbT with pleckstrin-like domain